MSTPFHLDPEPQDALSRQLTRALETPRPFTIPANFAALTALSAAQLPIPTATKPLTPFLTFAIRAAFFTLAIAMLALAAWARSVPNPQQVFVVGTELALSLEFVALTLWLSLRPPSSH